MPEITRGGEGQPIPKPVVGIIMGSASDLPVMKDAAEVLELLGVPYEVQIVSAHRTPEWMIEYAKTARERGLKVVVAGAGGAAHLPGMVASESNLPVIGVPVESKSLKGQDSLLSIVQMPPGIPVATMAINGAKNGGLYAARILAVEDEELADRLDDYTGNMRDEVMRKNARLNEVGWQSY